MGADLYESLLEYSRQEDYPFHMPGHKRQLRLMNDPYAIDITEIDGFDNLHHAEGVLLEAEQRAAELYGSEETHYLINGSTSGLLAAISAGACRGGRILAARNCHKSVYHAIFLNGLHVDWLYPDVDMGRGIYGSIDPEEVRRALARGQEITAVVLTSPTFDGVVSDIRRIARAAHEYGAILIVDEAHGAHFAMHSYFPESAVSCGADIVINSVHKTLPALTQTALIHVNGPWVDRIRLKKYLDIFQSSSPSYVLMAGIDRCVSLMAKQRKELYDTFILHLEQARQRLSQLKHLYLITGEEQEFPCFGYDRSRLVISTEHSSLSGQQLYQTLREKYRLQPEMAAEHYVILITTVADTQAGLERLCHALEEIDGQESGLRRSSEKSVYSEADAGVQEERKSYVGAPGVQEERKPYAGAPGIQEERKPYEGAPGDQGWIQNEEAMSMEEAERREIYELPLEESAGKVSGEYIYLYPPGIPLLIPGERITGQLIERLQRYQRQGFSLQGLSDYRGEKIRLVRE